MANDHDYDNDHEQQGDGARGGRGLRSLCGVVALVALAALAGCASAPPPAPYPHEYLLTVFAELKMGLGQDPYRLPPPRDLQGHNLYRVTLERIGSLAELSDPAYADVLAFSRGECLERLGRWREAAAAFDTATSAGTSLSPQARAHAEAARRMDALTDRAEFDHTNLETYLNDLVVMDQRLLAWADEKPVEPYAGLARLEAGRGRVERAELLFDHRRQLENGAARAIEIARSLTTDFKDSWRVSDHWLLLGSLYERLARDWTREYPPQRHGLADDDPDTQRWRQWVEQARIAYRKVALADGDPAKPEGEARMRALDAYALRMQELGR